MYVLFSYLATILINALTYLLTFFDVGKYGAEVYILATSCLSPAISGMLTVDDVVRQ